MPLLNYVLNNLEKNKLKWSILSLTVIISIMSVPNKNVFIVANGYSLLWLMVLYLIGGYIKKYNPFEKISSKNLFIIYLVTVLLSYAWFALTKRFLNKYDTIFFSYSTPNNVIAAICLFEIFKRIKVNKLKGAVKFITPLTFGVYLVHVNPFVFNLLADRFVGFLDYNIVLMFLAVIGAAIALFIVSALIDYLRLLLFKVLKIRDFLNCAEEKIKGKYFNGKKDI